MTKLLGLCGLAGSGKDTAAEALLAVGFERRAFADRMRAAVVALDPWVWDELEANPVRLAGLVEQQGWDSAKRDHPEVRRLLQRFGTEAGRDVHGDNCWVDLVIGPWLAAGRTPGLVVSDVRFENEAHAIKAAGGIVLQIVRPGLQRLAGGHSSEAGLAEHYIDARIVNEGTVDELHRAVLTVATHLFSEAI